MEDPRALTLEALDDFLQKQRALLKRTQCDLGKLRELRQEVGDMSVRGLVEEGFGQRLADPSFRMSDQNDCYLKFTKPIIWDAFRGVDPAPLQTLNSRLLQTHHQRHLPPTSLPSFPPPESPSLSPLQTFVKNARKAILDPVLPPQPHPPSLHPPIAAPNAAAADDDGAFSDAQEFWGYIPDFFNVHGGGGGALDGAGFYRRVGGGARGGGARGSARGGGPASTMSAREHQEALRREREHEKIRELKKRRVVGLDLRRGGGGDLGGRRSWGSRGGLTLGRVGVVSQKSGSGSGGVDVQTRGKGKGMGKGRGKQLPLGFTAEDEDEEEEEEEESGKPGLRRGLEPDGDEAVFVRRDVEDESLEVVDIDDDDDADGEDASGVCCPPRAGVERIQVKEGDYEDDGVMAVSGSIVVPGKQLGSLAGKRPCAGTGNQPGKAGKAWSGKGKNALEGCYPAPGADDGDAIVDDDDDDFVGGQIRDSGSVCATVNHNFEEPFGDVQSGDVDMDLDLDADADGHPLREDAEDDHFSSPPPTETHDRIGNGNTGGGRDEQEGDEDMLDGDLSVSTSTRRRGTRSRGKVVDRAYLEAKTRTKTQVESNNKSKGKVKVKSEKTNDDGYVNDTEKANGHGDGNRKANGKGDGKMKLEKPKPETYKLAWSDEEQRVLEELLESIPDGEKFRWQKISKAMGGRRTPRQVASRVQKYFEKLKRFGVG